jgi:hypothetical protein
MRRKYQHGLSLLWTAVFMGILAFVAAAGLISMRQERNILAESWQKLTGSAPARAMQEGAGKLGNATGAARDGAGAAPAAIRKCVVDGKVIYSDSACGERGDLVRLHETRGVEAPKKPVAPPDAEPGAGLREKMIDKATRY